MRKKRNIMKKKLFLVVTVFALVAILATCLVACNKGFKWHSVGGGDATAEVKSNGGYVVKQGNYLYFINGYVGLDENNDFGTPVKQSIVRVEIKNGVPDTSTAVVVVPKIRQQVGKRLLTNVACCHEDVPQSVFMRQTGRIRHIFYIGKRLCIGVGDAWTMVL